MKRLYIITGAKGHLAGTIIRALRGTDCYIRGLILPSETADDYFTDHLLSRRYHTTGIIDVF